MVEVLLEGKRLPGAANVGVRPTVGDLIKPVLEVHLLDFDQLIYGQRIHVEFKRKYGKSRRLISLEAMVTKILQ